MDGDLLAPGGKTKDWLCTEETLESQRCTTRQWFPKLNSPFRRWFASPGKQSGRIGAVRGAKEPEWAQLRSE
jgi:hypothetical protein